MVQDITTRIVNKHTDGTEHPMGTIFVAKELSKEDGYMKTIVRMYENDQLINREDHNLAKP